ncbi:hypothetical protein IGI04_026257 [Brassica rapa subsp. trilocularis]|uniref:CCHC-type domain-containing protein n=1 Tax=Brassica rapa subsp. trilocularis TaxID=1813537 RepID=A0ABQ7KY67_BRACM|nr:hypothetical protein IGI04_026257 [Brassica rapa subsp. trilocularis]
MPPSLTNLKNKFEINLSPSSFHRFFFSSLRRRRRRLSVVVSPSLSSSTMEVLCICGQWISKESLQWEFLVDLKRNASIISIEEDLLYEDLMKIVSEDFSVKEEEISLSYGFSLDMKCIIESFPPLSIGNTRQLRTFISKTRAFDGTCRLCVKVSTDPVSCNTQASDTFASTVPLNANPAILSTVQSEKQSLLYEGVSTVPLNALPDFSTDSASCNIQASDTFASTVPLNANPVILPTVQSEKQSFLYEGVSTVPLNALPDFSPVHIGLSPNTRVVGDIKLSTSTYPENIDELSCPPPATKKKSGRPPTKRKRSVGEFGVPGSKSQSHKCSRCGTGGHNKITCQRPIG